MQLWIFLYYVFSLITTHCDALKIFEHSLNASEYKLFYHRTADFGPQPGTYNVSGPLHLMHPLIACNIPDAYLWQQDTDASASKNGYHQIYASTIVLVLRGNCTFSTKIHNAELLGAIGVIVGDYNVSKDEWIVMSEDPNQQDGITITIPSVFVPHNTYQWMHKLILSHSASALSWMDPMESRDMLPLHSMQSGGVYAVLDADGEYVEPNSTFWLAAFGIVIIIIPTLWCFIVCIALVRRKIVSYVQRSRRRKHLNQIPIILYKESDPRVATVDSALPMAAEGDNYLNLENIEQDGREEMVNREEDGANSACVNMKNEIDAGSLSTNLKSMSRFLLDQFRGKKMYSHPHNDSCAICLDDFRSNEELRLLPCNHGFHRHCVDPWLTKQSELCPMCKQSIFVSSEDENVSNGCLPSISKVCCIRNRNSNRGRENNDGNVNMIGDDDENENDGIIVLAASQDELVPIDSDIDSNHSHSDMEDNTELQEE